MSVTHAVSVVSNPLSSETNESHGEQTCGTFSISNVTPVPNTRAIFQAVQPQKEKTHKNIKIKKNGKGEEGSTGDALPPPPPTK